MKHLKSFLIGALVVTMMFIVASLFRASPLDGGSSRHNIQRSTQVGVVRGWSLQTLRPRTKHEQVGVTCRVRTTHQERPVRKKAFASPYVLTLSVIDGGDAAAVFRINKPRVVVGRSQLVDFYLEDEQISNEHFAIEVNGTVYTLIDLDSRNGTELNDRPVAAQQRGRLKHADEISLGDEDYLLLRESDILATF